MFAKALAAGTALSTLIADADPVVQGLAIAEMSRDWQDAYVEQLTSLLRHDDPNLRWDATAAMIAHPSGAVTAVVPGLLADSDARVRSMALYLIPPTDSGHAVERLRVFMSDPCDLVRYDAASALIQSCGNEGKQAVKDLRGKEPNEMWRRKLESIE